MNAIDLSPLYRSTIGFDRLGALLDTALRADQSAAGYPPYNIEATGENRYGITLAVAGFEQHELDIQTERGVLTVRGKKAEDSKEERKYLHQGIATRSFERKFSLADHVEVTGAQLNNGLLSISLVKEIPEAMKPRNIAINTSGNLIQPILTPAKPLKPRAGSKHPAQLIQHHKCTSPAADLTLCAAGAFLSAGVIESCAKSRKIHRELFPN